MAHQKTICIDFDGVLHDYSKGYRGLDVFGEPVKEAPHAVQHLKKEGVEDYYLYCSSGYSRNEKLASHQQDSV